MQREGEGEGEPTSECGGYMSQRLVINAGEGKWLPTTTFISVLYLQSHTKWVPYAPAEKKITAKLVPSKVLSRKGTTHTNTILLGTRQTTHQPAATHFKIWLSARIWSTCFLVVIFALGTTFRAYKILVSEWTASITCSSNNIALKFFLLTFFLPCQRHPSPLS